jgi:transcriptional regulator with XRE-family HTH domain
VNVEHARRGGNRLRQLRLQRGLKQAALAARLGVDHTTVSAWERGRQTPAPSSLTALAALLGVLVEDLGFPSDDATSHRDGDVDRQQFLAGMAAGAAAAAMASMSRQAVDLGRPREAVHLADAALQRSGGHATARLTSVPLARRALAHAHDGDRGRAEQAFGRARELLGRGPDDADPPWTGFWGAADLEWHEGQAALALGSLDRAEERTRAALTAVDPVRYARSSALYLAFLATLLALRGAFDEGIDAAADAVLAAAHLGSARVGRQIATALQVTEARDRRAESRAFVRWASSRLRAA